MFSMKIESLTMHIFFLQILIRSSEVGRDENELPICIKTFYFVAEFSIKKCDSLLKNVKVELGLCTWSLHGFSRHLS